MRILFVHNAYARPSGEEEAIRRLSTLLESHGNSVELFARSSSDIGDSLPGKLVAFGAGIHSFSARAEFSRVLARFRPDIVQVQNLYPLISPSILSAAWEHGVPVVMRCPNYRLTCPTGLHSRDGAVCALCSGGQEHWCVLKNCAGSLAKSAGYAARSWSARVSGVFDKYVSQFVVLSEFQRRWFIRRNIPAGRISILPNMPASVTPAAAAESDGGYVAYVGRLSHEKGIDALFRAAKLLPHIPFRVAGTGPITIRETLPNVHIHGHLSGLDLYNLYAGMQMLICPSLCFEGFPGVIGEAMRYSKPVICSRIGGLPEIVQHEVTGLLVEPGNENQLASAVQTLWDSPTLRQQYGNAGRDRLISEFNPCGLYSTLMDIYERARQMRLAAGTAAAFC